MEPLALAQVRLADEEGALERIWLHGRGGRDP
jgi:hypothetical protein